MAAISLDSILNFIIPIAVWCFLAYILYVPFKEPINKLWSKISEWRSNREESYEDTSVKVINYE